MHKKHLPKTQPILKDTIARKRFRLNFSTSDLLSAFALIVAVGSTLFSVYTYFHSDELAKQTYDRNYRPYVYVESLGNNATTNTDLINAIKVSIINAPAKISTVKLSFYLRIPDHNDELVYTQPSIKNILLYPNDESLFYINSSTNDSLNDYSIIAAKKGGALIRKAKIDYEWISDKPIKYYFESECLYNFNSKTWNVLNHKAN